MFIIGFLIGYVGKRGIFTCDRAKAARFVTKTSAAAAIRKHKLSAMNVYIERA